MSQPSAALAALTESVGRLLIKKPRTPGRITESERHLDLALEAAFMVSFEWDIVRNRVTRFGSANPSLPTEGGPLTVEGVRDIVHPDDKDLFMANLQAAIQDPDGRYQSEFRFVLTDGRTIWASEYGHVEHDSEGHALRLIGLSQDITERKRTFQALQEERDRLQTLISNMSDEVWLADSEGKFTLANPSQRQQVGLASTAPSMPCAAKVCQPLQFPGIINAIVGFY